MFFPLGEEWQQILILQLHTEKCDLWKWGELLQVLTAAANEQSDKDAQWELQSSQHLQLLTAAGLRIAQTLYILFPLHFFCTFVFFYLTLMCVPAVT